MTRPPRKHIPASVKIEACLLLLGFPRDRLKDIQWDHDPAIQIRPLGECGTDYDPPQLSPAHIFPMLKEDHLLKTTGRRGESKLSVSGNGDVSRVAKIKRLESEEERPPSRWQSRKLESRGFDKTHRPLRRAR